MNRKVITTLMGVLAVCSVVTSIVMGLSFWVLLIVTRQQNLDEHK